MIAALFVKTNGPYFGLADVDPWDVRRDARRYPGPYPVVAHPPCERWGRYWFGGPSAKERLQLGDDGGCFESALRSVRTWGGVLEHPEASHAWRTFGLIVPLRGGGWSVADDRGGWTCCVEQGAYGHRARKATWLYAFDVDLPALTWRASGEFVRIDAGYHSANERAAAVDRHKRDRGRLTNAERIATPIAFRDELIGMARSVERVRRAA